MRTLEKYWLLSNKMKRIFFNAYFQGIFFSMLSMAVSLLVGLMVYPIYWSILSHHQFVTWFSTFEFSQLFLLMDVGFTQEFIRRCSGLTLAHVEREFGALRGTMQVVALIAFVVQLPIFWFTATPADMFSAIPFVLLAASIAVTIISYADTAALRVSLQFRSLYLVNIFANFVFLVIVYFGKEFGLYSISAACLVRAGAQYMLQRVLISRQTQVTPIYKIHFNGAGSAISMNCGYFLIFAFDAVLFNKMGVGSTEISVYIVNRKIYDVFRGLSDAAMNVLAVKVASGRSIRLLNFMGIIAFLAATIALAIAPATLSAFFKSHLFELKLSLALAFVSACTSLFRFIQLWLFMDNERRGLVWLFVGVALSKVAAVLTLQIANGSIAYFYFAQAIVMGVVILFCSIRIARSRPQLFGAAVEKLRTHEAQA